MALTVINAPVEAKKSGKFEFVLLGGVPWGIFSIGVSKVATVAKAKRLQQDSASLRVRVVRITPKRRGREWAIVVRKR